MGNYKWKLNKCSPRPILLNPAGRTPIQSITSNYEFEAMKTGKIKIITATVFIIVPCLMFGQLAVDKMIDHRDGRIYQTVQIDSTIWFLDNLMFETAHSYYPNNTKKVSNCPNGNFYPYKELASVCPDGWRIPNEKDWEQYFKYRIESQNGSLLDVQIDSLNEEYLTVIYRDTTDKVNLLEEGNPLRIAHFGWVEGNKFRDWGTTTFWIKNSQVEDKRFHLHLRNGNYTFHRHQHNLDDTRKKTRKFMVKCVSSIK